MKNTTSYSRIPEIDLLRGTAVIMMIIFHTAFDLDYFNIYNAGIDSGFWYLFGYLTGFLFVFIAGISVWISWKRVADRMDQRSIYLKFAKRGFYLFLIGMGITALSLIFAPESPIMFGTLHLIGFCVVIAPFFFRFSTKNIFIGIAIIAAGFIVQGVHGNPALLWIGIHQAGFSSLDYKPILPWLGYFLAGMAAAAWIYPDGRKKNPSKIIKNRIFDMIRVPGRHSLLIYIIHQPVIILLLSILAGRLLLSF